MGELGCQTSLKLSFVGFSGETECYFKYIGQAEWACDYLQKTGMKIGQLLFAFIFLCVNPQRPQFEPHGRQYHYLRWYERP